MAIVIERFFNLAGFPEFQTLPVDQERVSQRDEIFSKEVI